MLGCVNRDLSGNSIVVVEESDGNSISTLYGVIGFGLSQCIGNADLFVFVA